MQIKDILKSPSFIKEDNTFKEAVEKMIEDNSNSLIVIDDETNLKGFIDIVTLINTVLPEYIGNRDMTVSTFTTNEVLKEFIDDVKEEKVKDFMLEDPKTIHISSTMTQAIVKATEGRQSKIIVLDEDEKPCGIITRSTIKRVISDLL